MNFSSDGCKRKSYVIACTGASGVIYFISLLRELSKLDIDIHVILSSSGKAVLSHEFSYGSESISEFVLKTTDFLRIKAKIFEHDESDFFAPPASGSFLHDGMVIVPCSMKTIAAIAGGFADNLITRAADVALKERRKLIVVPRETPLNRIHLENFLKITDSGGVVLPASPGFYHSPESIDDIADFIAARIASNLGVQTDLIKQWGK